jgi:uncharacterized protein (DUF433 family)
MTNHQTSARIIADPNILDILAGKPIIAGTRISVQLILEKNPRWLDYRRPA